MVGRVGDHTDHGAFAPGASGRSRIAAIADVFDALTSNRVYRKAFHLGEAVDIMVADRGTHFDPELLDLFFDSMDEVVQIMDVRSR